MHVTPLWFIGMIFCIVFWLIFLSKGFPWIDVDLYTKQEKIFRWGVTAVLIALVMGTAIRSSASYPGLKKQTIVLKDYGEILRFEGIDKPGALVNTHWKTSSETQLVLDPGIRVGAGDRIEKVADVAGGTAEVYYKVNGTPAPEPRYLIFWTGIEWQEVQSALPQ